MRRLYGASPLHLLAHLALLPLAGYALLQLIDVRAAGNIFLWLLASVVLHDLVLLPFYSAVDRAARVVGRRARPPLTNHLRVPAGLSALMLLVFFGTIGGRGEGAFRRASGLEYEGYLGRWLLATAALFAISGVVYLVRLRPLRGGGSRS